MIKAVLFDMDGLMLDTERLAAESWDWAGEKLGFGPLGYMAAKTLGMNDKGAEEVFAAEFGGKLTCRTLADKAWEYITDYFDREGVPVKPGLFELLEYLKENHYRLVVATSTRETKARGELEQAGVLHYFDGCAFGDMIEHGKPAPDIFLKAAEIAGVKPDECLVLEDSPNGIRAGSAAGMKSIVIPDRIEPDAEILGKAYCRLNSLTEVIPLLERGL